MHAPAMSKALQDMWCHLRKRAKNCTVPLSQTNYRVQAHWAGVSSGLHCPDITHHHTPQSRLSTATLQDVVAGKPVLPFPGQSLPHRAAECTKQRYPGSKGSLTPAHSSKLVFENIKPVFSS